MQENIKHDPNLKDGIKHFAQVGVGEGQDPKKVLEKPGQPQCVRTRRVEGGVLSFLETEGKR